MEPADDQWEHLPSLPGCTGRAAHPLYRVDDAAMEPAADRGNTERFPRNRAGCHAATIEPPLNGENTGSVLAGRLAAEGAAMEPAVERRERPGYSAPILNIMQP
jgi:hypothetical protein